jgi:hypothetical protein
VHTYAYDPPGGGPRFDGVLEPHPVSIADARAVAPACSLAGAGFTLRRHASAVRDFWDESQLLDIAYPEAEALACELTGAAHARAFDHTLRRRAAGRPPLDGSGGSFAAVREPVGRVHLDYTPESAPWRVRQVLGDEAGTRVAAGRYVIVGLWRPILREPLLDAPLALADKRTVRRDDLVPNDLLYRERRGQTYAVRHNAGHRWFWFPRQRRDEVTAFIHYDSEAAGGDVPGAAPHTAFEDSSTPPGAAPRESLEMRVIAWFRD